MLVDVLRGNMTQEIVSRQYDRIKTFGVGHDVPARDWHDYLLQMLQLGLIEIAYDENSHLKVTEAGWQVLYGKSVAQLSVIVRDEQSDRNSKPKRRNTVQAVKVKDTSKVGDELLSENQDLFDALRDLRKKLADEQGFPPYIICRTRSFICYAR